MRKIYLAFLIFTSCTVPASKENTEVWIPLFNGTDLSNWEVKFAGQELGVNYKNTFRVKDGILTVSYSEYDSFNFEFGHLFTKEEFSSYILRAEYRFVNEPIPNAPEWAYRNNGFMLHAQSPATMLKDQNFPVSLEAQPLGGHAEG
ncbi:MAG: DUF1080 domain-containing protein, partial [Bacteroidota bacterium]